MAAADSPLLVLRASPRPYIPPATPHIFAVDLDFAGFCDDTRPQKRFAYILALAVRVAPPVRVSDEFDIKVLSVQLKQGVAGAASTQKPPW